MGLIWREPMVTPVSRGAAGAGSEPGVLCGLSRRRRSAAGEEKDKKTPGR